MQVFFSLVNGGEESDLLPAREAEDVGFSLLSLDESFSARESELELREEFPEEMFSGDVFCICSRCFPNFQLNLMNF